VIAPSRLGLELATNPFTGGFAVAGQEKGAWDASWRPVHGERSTVRDHYHELVIDLKEKAAPHRLLRIHLRAYDAGAAFYYTVPRQTGMDQIQIRRELTEFQLAKDAPAWATYTAQGAYTNVPISRIRPGCERPLVIRLEDDCYVALAEARLVDFARMKLAPLKEHPHGLVADLGSPVSGLLPLRSPWRVVMVGSSPGQLLERNDLLLNLNDPCAIADTSWIKPGKVIREVTLTTRGGKACVDFAVQRKLQYVEFDAGWYGPENDNRSDARAVNLDPARSKGPLDLHEVIRYANARGIGILLYVNRRALERQLDELLPLYQQWGVKGIKFGFVNVGSQTWTTWLHEAIRKAAEHRLMVDVHDEYRPTGWSRTYPNLMTQEGIRGDEERQPNEQSLTTLFTRMLAGAADNTICYYDSRVTRQSSHAYQLAKAACFHSPWQFLYWYDRPVDSPQKVGGAGNAETAIGNEPELEFFDHLPAVWDDTRVLRGRIGEYAVIARRSGDAWFVGGMNTDQPREFELPLSFLPAGRRYTAHVFSDDPSVPTRTHVSIERRTVDSRSTMRMALPPRGGQAIRLVPESE
jgi:alpha-glucosidase